jgi:multidrug efflux pump subunit AcrB
LIFMKKIIAWFAGNSLLTNFLFLAVILLGVYFWNITAKEEMPDMSWNRIRISFVYPGASPEDVERFCLVDAEAAMTGMEGLVSMTSTASKGSGSLMLELDEKLDIDKAYSDVLGIVGRLRLPDEVEDPSVRYFKSTQRPIMDVILSLDDEVLLSQDGRDRLQQTAINLSNQLEGLADVAWVEPSGYLQKEIRIVADAAKLNRYQMSLVTLSSLLSSQSMRLPAGNLEDRAESLVILDGELITKEDIESIYLRGSFDGPLIGLTDVAKVNEQYEEYQTIRKFNGRESITLQVVKSASSGIIDAADSVREQIESFNTTLEGSGIHLTIYDDESISVRQRLTLNGQNGAIGFVLILILLFIFLDFRSGFWVAMGIPFSFCLAMILASLAGMTINNMTLSAVIIVMGMVVDDAIVVTENITRLRQSGKSLKKSVLKGTYQVFSPVTASVITTCVAFLPLMMFSGFAGRMGRVIPVIIIFMLAGSLIESMLILPGHMNHEIRQKKKKREKANGHWFFKVEKLFSRLLSRLLRLRFPLILFFLLLSVLAIWLYKTQFNFSLFPGEDSDTIYIDAYTDEDSNRLETELKSRDIEAILDEYTPDRIAFYQSVVAGGRFGSAAQLENRVYFTVQLPSSQKKQSGRAQVLMDELENRIKQETSFGEVSLRAQRWGYSSGSAIEIQVQENDPEVRAQLVEQLTAALEQEDELTAVEADKPRPSSEYLLHFNREKLIRLGISPRDIRTVLGTYLSGTKLYEFPRGNDTIDVRLLIGGVVPDNLDVVLNSLVENRSGYLVPLKNLLSVEHRLGDSAITRIDGRRITMVYADLKPDLERSLTEIADDLESRVFPELTRNHPGSVLTFTGEIADTRATGNELLIGIIFVLLLIYMILAVTLKSLTRPLIIMLTIPLGAVGVIFAFYFHGIRTFGFYAGVGLIGLCGVVVNDAIVMMDRLRLERNKRERSLSSKEVAKIASTRLRAIILTTATTVIGLLPTAYGILGYDALLSQMMLAMAWGLVFGTGITLLLIPAIYSLFEDISGAFSSPTKKEKK